MGEGDEGCNCFRLDAGTGTKVRLQEIASGSVYRPSAKNGEKVSLVSGHF